MAQNNSSFHMGDEFNGSGKKTYLRATQHNKYKPLSQENVRLTPDYKQCISKVVGALPLVMDPAKTGINFTLKALGAMPGVSRVIVTKDKRTGKYQTSFVVKKIQLTTGAYLHKSQKQFENTISIREFIRKIVSRFIKKNSEQTTEKLEEDLAKDPAEGLVEDPAEDLAEAPAEDLAEAPAEDLVENPAEDLLVLDRYVNEDIFKAMGWNVEKFKTTYGEDVIEKLKEYMYQYGITNRYSICMFLATLGVESGDGSKLLEVKNPPDDATYKEETKGAGLIQVTGFDQKEFLKYLKAEMLNPDSKREDKDLLSKIQEYLDGYPDVFPEVVKDGKVKKRCVNTKDVAGFIAEYYPIESAVWYWAINKKCTYWEDISTIDITEGEKLSLNQYVYNITENMDVNDVDSMISKEGVPWENLFLAVQYYVKGSPWAYSRLQKIAVCMDDTYEKANGELTFTVPQGDPKEGTYTLDLPSGWMERADDWKQLTYELFG